MIRIHTRNLTEGKLSLGEILEIEVEAALEVETRFFLKHKPVMYLKPLTEWKKHDLLKLRPESPGDYALVALWRSPDGRSGTSEAIDFTVEYGKNLSPFPHRIKSWGDTTLWAPSEWDAIMATMGEAPTFKAIEKRVRSGAVIYDIGANLGKYSVPMARLTGADGHVYCFEANPVCLQYLRANLIQNQVTNAEILPVAVLDRAARSRFLINYGNVAIGLTDSSHFFGDKLGHEVEVRTESLDDIIGSYGLRPPDLIKIDIEGAEALAVDGMRQTLAEESPTLVLELHGHYCLSETLERLDAYGYTYQVPGDPRIFRSRDEVCEHYAQAGPIQLVAEAGGAS